MTAALIGVLGATGSIGSAVVAALQREGHQHLRLGARSYERLSRLSIHDHRSIELCEIDINHDVAAFCHGCQVVINCTGPSLEHLQPVGAACMSAGADYVDPGGDDQAAAALAPACNESRRSAIVGAGMLPGLATLLPSFLTSFVGQARNLVAYLELTDRLGQAGAVDYLAGLRRSTPGAAWRNKTWAKATVPRHHDVVLPFFGGPTTLAAHFSPETERVAASLGLHDATWYSVFRGPRVLSLLSRHAHLPTESPGFSTAATELTHAMDREVAEFGRIQRLVFELEGLSYHNQTKTTKTLLLESSDAAALTAEVAVASSQRLLNGHVAPGAHFADTVLDPKQMSQRLRPLDFVHALDIMDGPLADCGRAEEGAL